MSLRKDKVQLDVEINGKKAGTTYGELKNQARQLNKELDNLVPGTADFMKKTEELRLVNQRLAEVRNQTRGVGQAMDEARAKTGLFSKAFSIGAGFIAAQTGISSFFSLLKDSFTKYADSAKIVAQQEAVLTSTNQAAGRSIEELRNQAKELGKVTLFSGGQIAEAQNFLLTFTKISGEMYDKAIPAILDYATAFKIDLKTASVQVGKALNDPLKGLTSLSRAGVQFTKEQKEMISTMVASGNTAGAQAVILKELGVQFGNSAKAAADAGLGPYEMFIKQLNAIKKSLGEVLFKGFELVKPALNIFLKLFEKGIAILIGFVVALAKVPEFIKENKIAIGALIVALVTFNAQAIIAQANILRLAVIQKAQTIGTYALAVAQRVLNAAMNANPIGLIVGAIALLISGIALAYKNSEKFRAVLQGLGNVAKEFFKIFMEGFKAFGEGWDLIKAGKIGEGMKKFGEGLKKLNPVSAALTEGKRLGDAFNKGYTDSLAKSKADKEAEAFQKKAAAAAKSKPTTGNYTTEDIYNEDIVDPKTGKKTKSSKSDKNTTSGAPGIMDAILLQNAALKKAYQDRIEEAQKAAITQEQALMTELEQLKVFGLQESELYKQKEDALNKVRKEAAEKAQAEKLKVIQDALAAELGEAEKQFLQKMINEDQYNALILQKKEEALNKELELMKASGEAETAEYKAKELELTKIKAEGTKQREDAEKRYAEMYSQLQQQQMDILNDTFQLAIDLLGRDEKARKKNANAIKAFQVAQITINTASEISGIWKNANTNALNAIIPGWGQVWAGIQTGLAVGRAAVQISKVNSTQFWGGGYTGDGEKTEVAGTVHRGEYVFTKEEVEMLGGPRSMKYLKERLLRGYAQGGLATGVRTDPVGLKNVPIQSGGGADMSETNKKLDRLIDLFSKMPTAIRGIWVLSELEAKQEQYKRTLAEASI